MNNNIPNMNGTNSVGYNPQNPKPSSGQEYLEPQPTQQPEVQNGDPLKYVPGDQYGRVMVNQSQKPERPALNPQNIEDDILTFQLIQGFKTDLTNELVKQKGKSPEEANEIAAMVTDVLLNPNFEPQAQ